MNIVYRNGAINDGIVNDVREPVRYRHPISRLPMPLPLPPSVRRKMTRSIKYRWTYKVEYFHTTYIDYNGASECIRIVTILSTFCVHTDGIEFYLQPTRV